MTAPNLDVSVLSSSASFEEQLTMRKFQLKVSGVRPTRLIGKEFMRNTLLQLPSGPA